MKELGLSVSIIIMLSILVLLCLYLYLFFKKSYDKASKIIAVMFFHTLISLAIMSWALIIINQGFHIIGISLNWTPIAIIIFIIGFGLHYIDYYVRGKKGFSSLKTKEVKIYRVLLPTAYVIAFSLTTALFYFNCFYYVFLLSF